MRDIDATTPALAVSVLGPLVATYGGAPLPLGGRKQRAVLALLVCEAGRAVSTGRLVEAIWGDPAPAGAVASLQTYVSHLRHLLEPDRPRGEPGRVLVRVADGYALAVDRGCVDLSRFEDGVAAGDAALRRGELEPALAAYDPALALWRGDALSDLVEYDFVAPLRARLEELRLAALESRVDAELGLGRHHAVLAELGTLVHDHPLREELHAQRILALYRSGRQSEALAAYRELRSLLNDELGVEPSPPLQELNNRVLRQDPSLQPQKPTSAPARMVPAEDLAHPPASRLRGRALAVLAVGVVALTGGATVQAVAPPTAVALPANAVTELDGSGSVLASVPVGTSPTGVASAGGAIWVVNAGDDTVSEINPKTHAVQQLLEVGDDPTGVAVTGDDLWVTNFNDGTVSRINVPAGRVMDEITVGSGPAAVAAGTAGLWVANSGDNTIQRLDPTTGVPGPAIDVDDGPDGLAVDERSVWVANGRAGTVMRIDAATGDQMSAPITVGSGPRGLAVVGKDVWVADELSQSLTRITIATSHTHTLDVGDGPTALGVLGTSVWVAERYAGDLVRIDPASETVQHLDAGAPVRGLAVVGDRLWVVSGASTVASHSGGTLRIAARRLPGRYTGIDPAAVYDLTAAHPLRVVYDGLLAYHYNGADTQVVVPDLATVVPTPTDGGRTYTFNLRSGIRYSTGDEVHASDLRRGVKRALLTPRNGRPDFYRRIIGARHCRMTSCHLGKGVEVDDATGRITFHLTRPDPQFLDRLTLFIVPTPRGTPMTRLTTPLPGTGPYLIATYVHDKAFSLERNPYFHQWSAPAQPAGFPDALTWVKVPDTPAAVDAVLHGRADLAELTPLGDTGVDAGALVDALHVQQPKLMHPSAMQATTFGIVNSSEPPFRSRLARRALNFAVDRNRAVELLGGPSVAPVTCQLIPPTMPSYRPYCPYSTGPPDAAYEGPDLERARALVRRSGTLGTHVVVADLVDDINPPLDAFFAKTLERLGYHVSLVRRPDIPRNQDWFYNSRSNIQVQSGGWIADYPVPSNFYEILACHAPRYNYAFGYCNRALDQRAADATDALHSEPGAALRSWSAIDHDLADDAPVVPVANAVDWWLTSPRVDNYQTGMQDIGPLLSQLWVR